MCGIQTKKRRKIFAESYKSSHETMGNKYILLASMRRINTAKMLFLPKLIAKFNATSLKISRLSRTILMSLNRASDTWTHIRIHHRVSLDYTCYVPP